MKACSKQQASQDDALAIATQQAPCMEGQQDARGEAGAQQAASPGVQEALAVAEEQLCVVCWERGSGTKVHPCGHNYFCATCVRRFRTCPLCRVPLTTANGEAWVPSSAVEELPPERQPVLSEGESQCLIFVCFAVWAFIFVGGFIEYLHDVPRGCVAIDPVFDIREVVVNVSETRITRDVSANVCKNCAKGTCFECMDGFINHGGQCFKYYENLPSQKVGAALGGAVYFVLIIATQVCGIITELLLIRRLMNRQLMPRKELLVLGLALFIEISRMWMVDIFMLQDYFGGRAYSIYRAPVPCTGTSMGWRGADGQLYCNDLTEHSATTRYYLAAEKEAFTMDHTICSTFDPSSALLDFQRSSPSYPSPGSPRFENLGWIIGGEFALYYFFATFVNEFADCLFVVPTTTKFGWLCKIFSVALEVFQLGALCPAAIFTHADCLHSVVPMGVSFHVVSFIVCAFGYSVWGFLFFCLPLAGATFALLSLLWVVATMLNLLSMLFGALRLGRAQLILRRGSLAVSGFLQRSVDWSRSSSQTFSMTVIGLAFLPLLLSGCFLGALVVVGQASKQGTMEVLTALVLLSDVLLKIGATAATEIAEYLLHRRVRRAVAQRSASGGSGDEATAAAESAAEEEARPDVLGRPQAEDCGEPPGGPRQGASAAASDLDAASATPSVDQVR